MITLVSSQKAPTPNISVPSVWNINNIVAKNIVKIGAYIQKKEIKDSSNDCNFQVVNQILEGKTYPYKVGINVIISIVKFLCDYWIRVGRKLITISFKQHFV